MLFEAVYTLIVPFVSVRDPLQKLLGLGKDKEETAKNRLSSSDDEAFSEVGKGSPKGALFAAFLMPHLTLGGGVACSVAHPVEQGGFTGAATASRPRVGASQEHIAWRLVCAQRQCCYHGQACS